MLRSQESRRRNEAGEERGVEVDEEGTEMEEVVWPTALLLFSMEAEEHKAPRVGSCWDLGPAIKRHRYTHFLTLHRDTSHLSCSDPSGYHSHDHACAFRHVCSLDLLREKPGKHMTAEAPLAVTHPMFSHQVEERKWADDKRPVISTLCYSDGQILLKSPVSSWD